MMDFSKLSQWIHRPLRSVLGLAVYGRHIEATALRNVNGKLEATASLVITLPAELDLADASAVGRELRSQLEAASIRERSVVVTVPCGELLTTQTLLPPLSDTDAESLLQLEAEKGFHSDVSALKVSNSRCALPNGHLWVTLATLSPSRFHFLEAALAAAKLKPVGFSPAISELQSPQSPDSDGVITLLLAPGSTAANLQVTRNGGIIALRSLDGAVDLSGESPAVRVDTVSREIKITLGQLPEELESGIRLLRVLGPSDLARSLATGLESRLGAAGFRVEAVTGPSQGVPSLPQLATAPFTAATRAAARKLQSQPAALEFLPPRPSALEQFLSKHTQGRLRTTWTVGGAAAVLVGGVFLVQQIQLAVFESRWSAISNRVRQLESTQKKIQQFRPWASDSYRSLRILEALTKAFPENGTVTAKVVEVRENGEVLCSGTASDSASLLRMLDRLHASPGVTAVHSDQIRGKSPLQFSLNFRWNGGNTP